MKRYLLATLVTAALAIAGCKPQQPQQQQAPASPAPVAKSANAVKLELFVMSQCPYGVQVVNAMKEVADKLGPELDLQINYIGNAGPNGQLSSMHGPDEVTGDIAQLCMAKYAPAKYVDAVFCQNKNYREVAKNWESCAQESKLPVEQIKACVTGDEGKQLLKASFDLANQKNARGSPTIFLDGKPYNGRRAPNDFLRGICAAYKGATKPAACANIPEPPKVNVTVLGDKRCSDCRTDQLVNMLKFRIANPVLKELDYADAEGKALYDELGGGKLPMVLFDETLDADKEASGMFGRRLAPAGTSKYKVFPAGGSWEPACANEGGCKLDQCKSTLACRPETANGLELFVMSQCPYGVRALNAMEEVLKNFQGKVDFKVHFIGNGDAKAGLQSMHGPAEVEEDIRELCAMKRYAKNYKFMDYVLCRNKDLKGDWKACTGSNGIDTKAIEKCSTTDEGKKLLEEDFKVANGLGIGASPTWIANGKFKFSGIDAETVRRNICEHNKDLKGCENKLTSGGAPVQGGCGK